MRSNTVFPLILALVLSLVLVPVVNADCVELKYDDGESEASHTNLKGNQVSVKFSLPVKIVILVKARFEIASPGDFYVHVYDLYGNDLISPLLVTVISGGWVDVPLDVLVSGDFFIALEFGADLEPWISIDQFPPVRGHSFYRENSTVPWLPNYDDDLMIRAVVCELPPVGGELLPNNVTAIGTLIIAGISTLSITIGLAFKKRRPI